VGPRTRSLLAAAAVLVACQLVPLPARAQGRFEAFQNRAAQVFDVVVLRPLGLCQAAVGAALFVPAAVVTAPGGKDAVEEAWEMFVVVPAKNVFQRPLGDF